MTDFKENLSMIDCGIKSLKDMPFNMLLKSINFHSNHIERIENLNYLKNLVHLDLSSNKITQIEGLDGLVSLQTLNLSCNFITSIENLYDLKRLLWINLSFNKIKNTNGLTELWGNDHSLETLLLHNNFIISLEDIFFNLKGLSNLKHLTLYDNKLINYREYLFKNISNLVSIDGKNKRSENVKYDLNTLNIDFISEYNEILDLKSPITNKSSNYHNRFENTDLNKTSVNNRNGNSTNPVSISKLEIIEKKIHHLLSIRNSIRAKNKEMRSKSNSSSSSEGESSHSKISLNKIDCNRPKNKLIGILKQSGSEFNKKTGGTLLTNNEFNNIKQNDLISYLQEQLNSYKNSEDLNKKLIEELKANIDIIKIEQSESNKKYSNIENYQEKLSKLETENNQLTQEMEKTKQFLNMAKVKEEKLKENFKNSKLLLKIQYTKELDKNRKEKDQESKHQQDKIESLEKSYKSLEDEFRSALVIESNRYSELFTKYEKLNTETLDLKGNLKESEQNEKRNKALIEELNKLIKDQKHRIIGFTKMRQEANEDIHKRNEKLSEAVADCIKLKSQIEQVKKDKKEIENNFKKFLIEYNDIKKEKESWNKILNEQKLFLMQENNRLEIENRTMISEIDLFKKNNEKELDNLKIKSKIIDDQTETIKKLKNALLERDDLLRKNQQESIETQKSLEKRLNDEIDLQNEYKLKYEKSNEKKENIKVELEKIKNSYDEIKFAYNELSNKWKDKSDLISELDYTVRKMKETYEIKESQLKTDKMNVEDENNILKERLRKVDDEFRLQYDIEKKNHLKIIEKIKNEYQVKLEQSDNRTKEIENEMRSLLIETNNNKKFYEDKIKNFTILFSQIQQDFKI
jgi:leucine-rich repeat/coiled-coil domain-containing protein 1